MHHAQAWTAGHGPRQISAQLTLDRSPISHVPAQSAVVAGRSHGTPSCITFRHVTSGSARAQTAWHSAWQDDNRNNKDKPEDEEEELLQNLNRVERTQQQPPVVATESQGSQMRPRRDRTDLQASKQTGNLRDPAQRLMGNMADNLASGKHIICTSIPSELHRATLVMTPVVQQILEWNAAARKQHRHPSSQSLLKVKAVVICATREGAEQMHQVAYKLLGQHGLRAQLAQSRTPLSQDIDMLRAATPEVIAMTPGRALELLTQAPRGCKLHEVLGNVRLLVLEGVEQLLGSPAMRVQTEPFIAALNSLWQQQHACMEPSASMPDRQVILVDHVQQLSQETATHAAALMQLFTGQTVSANDLTSIPQQPFSGQQSHALTAENAKMPVSKVVKVSWHDINTVADYDIEYQTQPHTTQAVHVASEADITVHLFTVLRQHVKQHPRHRILVMCPSVALARVWCRVAKQLGFAAFDFNTRKSSMYRAAALQAFRLRPGPHRPQHTHKQASHNTRQRRNTQDMTSAETSGAASGIQQHVSPDEALLDVTDNSGQQQDPHGSAAGAYQSNPADVDDIADLEEVWGAPGLVLFTAGGSTQDVHFPHLTCLLQVGLPRHQAQLVDFTKHTRTIAACRLSHSRSKKHLPESMLLLSRHELSGLSAFGPALEPLGIHARCSQPSQIQTSQLRHSVTGPIPGNTQQMNHTGMLQRPSWAASSQGLQRSQDSASTRIHTPPATATATTISSQQLPGNHHTSVDWVVVTAAEDYVARNQQHAHRVDTALSNIGIRLREAAWLSWLHHQYKHSMMKLPTSDAWLRMCRDFTSALALQQLPSVPKEVAAEWGTSYMQGLRVIANEPVSAAQDDESLFNAAMGMQGVVDEQGSAAESAVKHLGKEANDREKQRQRESARLARQRLSRPYTWQAALYGVGNIDEDSLRAVVQKGLNKQYARRWMSYHSNLARWYQRLRFRKRTATSFDDRTES